MNEIILKENGDILEIHFKGEVVFLDGFNDAGKLLERRVDVIAFSNEFEKIKQS